MQSRKELAEAGRRKLEEFRKAKAQGKVTTPAAVSKHPADAPPTVAVTLGEANGSVHQAPQGSAAPVKPSAVGAPNSALQGVTVWPPSAPTPLGSVHHLPVASAAVSAPIVPAAEPSPAKSPATTFVVLQDAPIPFGAPSPIASPIPRPSSSSGVGAAPALPGTSSSGVFPWLPVSNPAISVAQRNSRSPSASDSGSAQPAAEAPTAPTWSAGPTTETSVAPQVGPSGPPAAASSWFGAPASAAAGSPVGDMSGSRPAEQSYAPSASPLAAEAATAPVHRPDGQAPGVSTAGAVGAPWDTTGPRPAVEGQPALPAAGGGDAGGRDAGPAAVPKTAMGTPGAKAMGTTQWGDTAQHAAAAESDAGVVAHPAASQAYDPDGSAGATGFSALSDSYMPGAADQSSGAAFAQSTAASVSTVASGALAVPSAAAPVGGDVRPSWLAYSAPALEPVAGVVPAGLAPSTLPHHSTPPVSDPTQAHAADPLRSTQHALADSKPIPEEVSVSLPAVVPPAERDSAAGAYAAPTAAAATWGLSTGYDQLSDSYLSPLRPTAATTAYPDPAAAAPAPAQSPAPAATPTLPATTQKPAEAPMVAHGGYASATPPRESAPSPLLPLSFPAASPGAPGTLPAGSLGLDGGVAAATPQAVSSDAFPDPAHARPAATARAPPAPSRFAWLFGTPKVPAAQEEPQPPPMPAATPAPAVQPTAPASAAAPEQPAAVQEEPQASRPLPSLSEEQPTVSYGATPFTESTSRLSAGTASLGGHAGVGEGFRSPQTAWGSSPEVGSGSVMPASAAPDHRTWEPLKAAASGSPGEASGRSNAEAAGLLSFRSPDPRWPDELPKQDTSASGLSWGGLGGGEERRTSPLASAGPFGASANASAAGLGLQKPDGALPSFLRPAAAASQGERPHPSAGATTAAPWEAAGATITPSAPSFSTSFLPASASGAASSAPSLPPRPPAPPQPAATSTSATNPQFAAAASYLSAYSAQPPAGDASAAATSSTASFLESYLDNLLSTMPASANSSDGKAAQAADSNAAAGAADGAQGTAGASMAGTPRTSQSGDQDVGGEPRSHGQEGAGRGPERDGGYPDDAGEGSSVHGHLEELAVSSSGYAGGDMGAMRAGALSRPESMMKLRGHHSRRASVESMGVVSEFSHATGLGAYGNGASSTSNRAQFAALQQHIDELTEEKLALSRGLQQQTRINEQLAEENQALMLQYNARGAAMEELQRKIKQYEQELQAQALSLEGFSEERHAARSSYAEASARAQAMAAEVVGLESQVLQLKSAVLKAERAAEESQQRARTLEKQVASLTQEAAERAQELQQVQLKGRNLVVKLKQTEAKLQAAEEKLEAQAALVGPHGMLGARLLNGYGPHAAPPKPTAEQEVQCDLASEQAPPAVPQQSTAAAGAVNLHSRTNSGVLTASGSRVDLAAIAHGSNSAALTPQPQPETAVPSQAPSGGGAGPDGQLALVPTTASAGPSSDSPDTPDNLQQQQHLVVVDWSAARPQHDAPSSVVADRALSSLDTGALRRGQQGLPEGLEGVALQLARWLPAGPVSGGDPVAVMVEEELRLMQSIHELIANFEEAQEVKAKQVAELQARVESLTQENSELLQKLELQTQRLELHLQGSMSAASGQSFSLHQTPLDLGGVTSGTSNPLATAAAPEDYPPIAAVSAPVDHLTTPTRSAPSFDSHMADVGSAGPPSRQQGWMGYLFRSRQKKRVRAALL
ncbi:hypothetical protein Agub_g4728 [Astrephomene gubernaculifera]|uniref:Uncharacterized protein n=1 Tax=Astrephomene gubernaculifera TaxID=47775 RepID=A0AAD3DLZ9_9CHLO|nr:hypothetical protein Agub_g4728 [Astrephomene gubernaculifera]